MENTKPQNERLASLDALRGFDMMFIMGVAGLISAICAMCPGTFSDWIAGGMGHVQWNGLTHHDTIFPLFLFIAGVSFPYSYAKQQDTGRTRPQIYRKIIIRGLVLVLLGAIYNGLLSLDFAHVRYASVLGRIGLAWMFAALLYMNFKKTTRVWISVAILIGYWLLLKFVPAPDVAGAEPYSYEGNLVGFVDRQILPGRLCYDGFDPEGILSTLPAIVTAMLGMFTGEIVRGYKQISGARKSLYMALGAALLIGIGLLWNLDMPICKKLWSSSFVCVVGGYSLAMFALFYYIIDVRGWKGWIMPFQVIGLNSITIYLLQQIVDMDGVNEFIFGGLAGLCGTWSTVVIRTGYVLTCWGVLYFLYRKKIFLKV